MDNQPINPAEQPVQPIAETPVAPATEPAPAAPAAPVAPVAPAAAPTAAPAPKKSNGALIGIIVGVVVALIVGGFIFWSITSSNKGSDSGDTSNSGSNTPAAVIPADQDSSYFIKIDGKTFTNQSKVSDFADAGYTYNAAAKDTNIPAGKYMILIGAGYLSNKTDNTSFDIMPYNDGDEGVKFPESKVGKVTVSQSTDLAKNAILEKITFYGDIHLGSTEEEVLSAFGEPSEKTEQTDYKKNPYTQYEFRGSVYQKFEIQVQDGKVIEISWTNYGTLAD
jgi:hypothetical protein